MAQLASQQQIFLFQTALLERVADQNDDLFKRQRLLDEIKSPELGGAHSGFDGAMARDHDHRGRAGQRLQAAERFEAIDARKPDVEKDDFQITHCGTLQGFLRGCHGFHVMAFVAEDRSERLSNAGFVVDDEEAWSSGHGAVSVPLWSAMMAGVNSATGNSMTKREPMGELSSTWMLPPCSAMMRAAMARPSPVPRSFVEKCGRNNLSLSSGEIPWPVSETEISTVSESVSALVETAISPKAEFSRASAALSMRFTTTLRSKPVSALT